MTAVTVPADRAQPVEKPVNCPGFRIGLDEIDDFRCRLVAQQAQQQPLAGNEAEYEAD